MARVTISDIADRAGLSKGAVSYALNDKAGVSDETRARVLAIADELGWTANLAARALSRSRSDAIGLVLARPARMLGIEPFYMEFISGVEDAIATRGIALMLHVVSGVDDEIETYRRWWSERRMDGIILVDMSMADPRVDVVRSLGIPAVSVSSPAAAAGLPNVWTDDTTAMTDAVQYLVALGHRRIARVAGTDTLSHTQVRDRAFRAAAGAAGLADTSILNTDFSGEAGAAATRALLASVHPPSAIVFDNDIMAVAALGVAAELGVDVPGALSLLAWDDSAICEITHPSLSAMRHDIPAMGSDAAELLLRVIDGEKVSDIMAATPRVFPRGSTAAAPGR